MFAPGSTAAASTERLREDLIARWKLPEFRRSFATGLLLWEKAGELSTRSSNILADLSASLPQQPWHETIGMVTVELRRDRITADSVEVLMNKFCEKKEN
jgi:hypothetical protein